MSKLMENLFDFLESPGVSEAERQAIRESREAVQAVKDRLTLEEFDNFWKAVMDIEASGYQDSFNLGFRLGMQLTIEGLRPIVE